MAIRSEVTRASMVMTARTGVRQRGAIFRLSPLLLMQAGKHIARSPVYKVREPITQDHLECGRTTDYGS